MKYFHEEEKKLKDSLNILAMIYFCLFLIVVVSAGVSMMFYACLKRQGYLIPLMHVLLNAIRFFIFSFFLYGTTYGIFFLILSDLIGVMKMIFEKNLPLPEETNPVTSFLKSCLFLPDSTETQKTFFQNKVFLDTNSKLLLTNCFKDKYKDCNDIIGNEKICDNLCDSNLGYFNFDCSFLKSDLHHLYKALNDASNEAQKLSAISLCAAFFGAVSIYFYLLVMHHYNNELFFDSGKSIFTGFDGF